MHLDLFVPQRFQEAAELEEEDGVEATELDSGITVTNQRWAEVRRTYNVAMPPMRRADPDLAAMRSLWRAAVRSHSFNLVDPFDGVSIVRVKFQTEFKLIALGANNFQIPAFTLIEAKEA